MDLGVAGSGLGGVVGFCLCGRLFLCLCLNSFVIKVVSLPVYVNVAQGCAVGFLSGCGGICRVDFGGRMLWIIFSSCWNSAGGSW
jgi:hypothetical protein